MQYIRLREYFKNFSVFSLADIKMVEPDFQRRRLNEWQAKGYIIKVLKGYYIFSDLKLNENALFEIANKIYAPSYISFEMALAYYGLIPESVYGITSASSRKTCAFKTKIGVFTYRSVADRLFFGYDLISYDNKNFKIASPEKAILDYFYINPAIAGRGDFASLRINKDVFFRRVDEKRLNLFLKKFGQKTLSKRIQAFLKFMGHA